MYLKKVAIAQRTKTLALELGILVAFACCTTPASAAHLDAIQAKLDVQRQQWQALNVSEYTYRLQRSCNCPLEFTEPGVVSVSGGQITSVKHAVTSNPLDPEFFLTVDGLFEQIQAAIDSHADEIVADYDASFGYPLALDIDFITLAVDDEISYRASELNVVPEPNGGVLFLLGFVSLALVRRNFHRRV